MTVDNNKFNQNKGNVDGKHAGQGHGNVGSAKQGQPSQLGQPGKSVNPGQPGHITDRNSGLGKTARTPGHGQDQKFGSNKTAGGKNSHGNTGSNNKDW